MCETAYGYTYNLEADHEDNCGCNNTYDDYACHGCDHDHGCKSGLGDYGKNDNDLRGVYYNYTCVHTIN